MAPLRFLPAPAADPGGSAAAAAAAAPDGSVDGGFVDGRFADGSVVDVAATLADAVAAAEQELQAVREDMVAAVGAVSWSGVCGVG